MTPQLLLLGLRITGVIDRVEGDQAVIEWREDALTDLPLAILPPELREGDRLIFRFGLQERGAVLALESGEALLMGPGRPITVHLPLEARLRAGHRYRLRVRHTPSRPHPGVASRPRQRPAGSITPRGLPPRELKQHGDSP